VGTNYYWHERLKCKCCNRPYPKKHIGKSSFGYAFALHIYPEEGIYNLNDWQKLFNVPNSWITNEYGEIVSTINMNNVILRPKAKKEEIFVHCEVDGKHCIGNEYRVDYIVGEFS
jgi:hypothetical protein